MKALKIVGIVLIVLVLLVAGGVAVIVSQFDAARVKAEAAKLVREKQQRSLTIDGELALSFWPNVGISLGRVSLSEHQSEQRFASLESARVSVAVLPLLARHVVVNEVQLKGLQLTVVKRKDGTLNIADLIKAGASGASGASEAPSASAGEALALDVAGLNIADAELGWRDEASGSSATLSVIELSTGRVRFDPQQKSYSVAKLALAMKGRKQDKGGGGAVDAKFSASILDGRGDALQLSGLVVDIDAKMSGAAVKGQLAGELRADLAHQSAEGQLSGQVDQSKLALKFGVTKFSPLAAHFDLDLDQIDVDRYLPAKVGAATTSAKPAANGGETSELDFSALEGLNLSGSLSVGQLTAHNIKLAKLKLSMRAANGGLEVAPLSASLYEGTLSGSLSVKARDNSVALKQQLLGVSIASLLKDAIGRDMIEGRGNVALDLGARGKSVGAMKKALAGTASLSLKDGAIKGINLAQSLRDLKGKLGAKPDAAVQNKSGDKTDFSELSASFKINGGVAHNDDLSAKSPFLRLTGSGDIDIAGERLNYLLKASVVATAGGQGAKDLDQLKGLTLPVRLSGPFDNPGWNIEFASLVGDVAKARVEETKQKLQEKVQDRLKGLLGR